MLYEVITRAMLAPNAKINAKMANMVIILFIPISLLIWFEWWRNVLGFIRVSIQWVVQSPPFVGVPQRYQNGFTICNHQLKTALSEVKCGVLTALVVSPSFKRLAAVFSSVIKTLARLPLSAPRIAATFSWPMAIQILCLIFLIWSRFSLV